MGELKKWTFPSISYLVVLIVELRKKYELP